MCAISKCDRISVPVASLFVRPFVLSLSVIVLFGSVSFVVDKIAFAPHCRFIQSFGQYFLGKCT